MNTHPNIETISRYLDQALPEEEARGLENHFEECLECRRRVEILRAAGRVCAPPQARLDAISRKVMASVRARPIPERVVGAAAVSSAPKSHLAWLRGFLLGARQSGARPRRRLVFALSAASVAVPAVVIAVLLLNGMVRDSMTRSRFTGGREHLRSLATAIETYTVDANQYVVHPIGPASPPALGQPAPTPVPPPSSPNESILVTKGYTYDPRRGSTSSGDIWRVKDGGAPLQLKGTFSAVVLQDRTAGLGYIHPSHATELSGISSRVLYYPLGPNTESYAPIAENPFLRVRQNPLSTFGIDVDTASYSNMRRFLSKGQLPPRDAVRIEELINYFPYDYPAPDGELPFSIVVEVGQCPWNDAHRLVRIGLKGREVLSENRPVCNLVFLLDVSGSMVDENKLPLVKKAMRMLVKRLSKKDRVAIVTYASGTQIALPSTSMYEPEAALAAIDQLQANGSTNGAAGIQLAYQLAQESFIRGGINRVILATDGDFNVGVTSQSDLVDLIERKAKSGIFLSVFGFGMDNLKDSTLEKLADKGNGNYGYIDTETEARKALGEQINGTLVTIAKDVKIQVEFNPAEVAAYRLIGYENRLLAKEDFNDDTKDAGEIGAGHTVTALYEIVPVGSAFTNTAVGISENPTETRPLVDPLKYQRPRDKVELTQAAAGGETLTVKLRYKEPDGDTSKLLEFPAADSGQGMNAASPDFRFAASVASFGMLLRDSKFKGDATFQSVEALAKSGLGADTWGYRQEFLSLVQKAAALPNP
jgi:Ca-activated chloride channel family protein